METVLEIKRKFTKPGIDYTLVMNSYNMHNEEDTATLTWKITCANPIVPEDWTLTYDFVYTLHCNTNTKLCHKFFYDI